MAALSQTYSFSGHETFHCRHFWLKKGYDFLMAGHSFTAKDAVVHLGVGKNMVASIRYWMRAFGIMDDAEATPIAHQLFAKDGWDPFIENPATAWLLHYQLVSTGYASLYPLVFNHLSNHRVEFSWDFAIQQIEARLANSSKSFSHSTLKSDLQTFRKNYVRPTTIKSLEDDLSGLLIDLGLVQEAANGQAGNEKSFRIESIERKTLPFQLVLFSILKNTKYGAAITFQELLNGINSPGRIFALSASGLLQKIEEICDEYPSIAYSSDAGIQQIMIGDTTIKENPFAVLNPLYE